MVHLNDAIRHSVFTFGLRSMQPHASSLIECTLQDFNSSGLVMNLNNTSFVLAHGIGKTYKKMIYTGKYITVNTAKYFTINTLNISRIIACPNSVYLCRNSCSTTLLKLNIQQILPRINFHISKMYAFVF